MSEEKMREEFEVAAKTAQGLDVTRLPHGGYRSFATHQVWWAWQASRAAMQGEPDPCQECGGDGAGGGTRGGLCDDSGERLPMTNFKIVPVEPTWDMEETGQYSLEAGCYAGDIYANMLADAPAVNIVATKNEQGQIVSVTLQDEDHRILEVIAEAAAQGEPIGYIRRSALELMKNDELGVRANIIKEPRYRDCVALYTAPQPPSAPVGVDDGINVPAAKALIKIVGPGFKVIYRDAFRWKDASGDVLPNHYETFSSETLARDFGYDLVLDLGYAAILRDPSDLSQQPAEQKPCPEGIREGAPYDDPAFESLCREHEIWGTAAAAQCAVFWEAGKRVAEQQLAPDVEGLEEAPITVIYTDGCGAGRRSPADCRDGVGYLTEADTAYG